MGRNYVGMRFLFMSEIFYFYSSLLCFAVDKMDTEGMPVDKEKLYVCIADTRKPSPAS